MNHSPEERFSEDVQALEHRRSESPDATFVTQLESRLVRHLPKTSMNTFFSRFFSRPAVPATILAVAVIVAGGFFAWSQYHGTPRIANHEPVFRKLLIQEAQAQENFTLTPTESDSLGVALSTKFRLTSKTAVSCDDVAASLAVTPDVSLHVKTLSSTECEITPSKPLDAGKLYQVALGATVQTSAGDQKHLYKWAYQAKEELQVVGSIPRDKATGVPIDTGIDITFTTNQIKNFDQHFSIVPATKGRFEQHGRTWSFVPAERLKSGVLYTVTIRKDLGVTNSDLRLHDDVVFRFETAATYDTDNVYVPPFSSAFTAVKPDEPPVIDFSYATPPNNLKATVYRFQNVDDLIERFKAVDAIPTWAYYSRSNETISTDGLTRVGEFPLATEGSIMKFPSGFDRGYYLVSIVIGKKTVQTPLVVSDIGASLTLARNTAVLWLYDLKTDKSLTNATVKSSLTDDRSTSDSRGIAQLPTPSVLLPKNNDVEISRGYFLVTSNDGRQTLVPVLSNVDWRYGRMSLNGMTFGSNDYWTYLWTDRTLYKPTDTVNVWGVLKNRENPKKTKVTFEVWTWEFVDAGGNYIPVATGSAETNDYGSYSASLDLRSLKPGYYTLAAKVDGVSVASRSFEVRKFTKPAYEIKATPNIDAGIAGDTVRYDIKTLFYDGTVAPHTKLRYASYGSAGEPGTDLTTDDQGHASLMQTLELENPSRQYPSAQQLVFFPTDSAEGDIAATAVVIVYPSGVIFTPHTTQEGDKAAVDFTVSTVDFSKVSSLENMYGDYASAATLGGKPVPNTPIEGTVYEVVTNKTKSGSHYDYLEKKVIDDYWYTTNNEKRDSFKGTTDDKGYFSKTFTLKGDAYLIDFSAQDTQGRKIVRSVYLYKHYLLNANGQLTTFSVRDANNPNAQNPTKVTYRIGDTTSIQLLQNGDTPPTGGTFLFLKLQNGVRDVTVTNKSSLRVTFGAADAPNINYTAVWFHNGQFQAPANLWDLPRLDFDESSRKLTVTVTPQQAAYAPGQTAKLDVSVKDPDGHGVQAMVNLSAIDEALAAIQQENPPAPLALLYAPVDSGVLQEYISHAPLSLESGAEGGGGGDGNRKDFKDAVLFKEVETSSDGTATVSLPLPDNITSWSITAQAVTKSLFAGHSITSLPVTKSLFGVLTMAEDYVVNDKPVIIAHAYGASLSASDAVAMRFTIPDLSIDEQRTVKAYAAESFPVAQLTEGSHTVILKVTNGKNIDTLERTLIVLPSRLTKTTSNYADVTIGMKFTSPGAARSTLVFSDSGRGRILSTAESLEWAYGKRLDRSLAAKIAIDVMKQLDPKASAPTNEASFADFQQDDGGISLVTYGSSDLRLSAFAAADGNTFDAVRLREYLEKKLEEKNASLDQIGYALLGLANLGEPVLPDLQNYLALDGITDEHRLIAAVAYTSIGANDQAYAIAKKLLTTYGETQAPYIRLKLGATDDARIVNTAEFSIIAEALKLNERIGIGTFLSATFPKDTITNLERALAQRAAVPNLDDTPVSFRYSLNGEEKTVELTKERSFPLSVMAEDLPKLSILEVKGPVGVTQFSQEALNPSQEPSSPLLGVTRDYSIVGDKGRPIQQGDIVRITITPKAGSGIIDQGFLVTDELPTGLVLLSRPWERGLSFDQFTGYPIEIDGQRVVFYSSGHVAFNYYARVLTPGIYAAEPTVIQGEKSRDLVNYSGAQSLEIH